MSISIKGLNKHFGKYHALRDVELSIPDGELVALLGPSGGGKTTLLRILSGQEEFDDGELLIPAGYSIGYLSQHISFTAATVLEEAARYLPLHDGAWVETHKTEIILDGLGFSAEQL
ncbi:MAG TPA: ATP-binding cassette domain-containing protein, partial [Fibrobacteria bacterium]|nr:ATP-binding cassette domain-containing protein [Fibrobacteria bacterium]